MFFCLERMSFRFYCAYILQRSFHFILVLSYPKGGCERHIDNVLISDPNTRGGRSLS